MSKWYTFKRWISSSFQRISGKHISIFIFVYIALGYLLLYAADETHLIATPEDYLYYLLVTASTVGYGDLSPETSIGKWVVAFLIIPVGLSLFAVAISQIAGVSINYWRRGLLGIRSINVKDHILILGWNDNRTIHLIEMLLHEEKNKRPIVLCVRAEMENPLQKDIDFVRTKNFTDNIFASRANIAEASCIIIDNTEDDITFSAALFCASRNPKAHILSYFHDDVLSNLLQTHCPNAECIPSLSNEMLAKSAVDPGSSALHHELMNSKKGMTQYAVSYPLEAEKTTIEGVFYLMKNRHEATLIGIKNEGAVTLNPPLTKQVSPGDLLFYIADERVNVFQW